MQHKTVLLNEAVDGLNIKAGDIFVDGTLGGGGHTEEVVLRLGNTVRIVGIDLDTEALERSKVRLNGLNCDVTYIQGSFRNIDVILNNLGITGSVGSTAGAEQLRHGDVKILLDIGLSSNQFEDSGRGFSFQKDEPLIMSFKKDITEEDLTAREIVNNWDQENIQAILEGYGEEQFAWKISKAIVSRREVKPIETTFELVEIIKSATPKFYHTRRIHPATKTFQALRITVNDEIESLKEGIQKSFNLLSPHGRLAVISFHSLEDRQVKQFFSAKSGKDNKEQIKEGILITKKPTIPTDLEIAENPRSRSAKLRIIEKL